MAKHVAVIGGGLSGLTYAWALKRFAPSVAVTVLEATGRTGGWLHSHRGEDGFLFERGCRGIRGGQPVGDGAVVIRTLHDLGLTDEASSTPAVGNHPLARQRFIKHAGALHAMPSSAAGLLGWAPLPDSVFLAFTEAFKSTSEHPGADETVRDFIARRLSEDAADRLVDAMAAGVWAGRIDELSVRAVFPQLAVLEEQAGSITAGFARRALASLTGSANAEAGAAKRHPFADAGLDPWFASGYASSVAEAEDAFEADEALAGADVIGATSISTPQGTEAVVAALARQAEGLGVEIRRGVAVTALESRAHGGATLRLRSRPEATDSEAPLAALGSTPAGDASSLEADLVVSAAPSWALADALSPVAAAPPRGADELLESLRSIPRSTVGVVCSGWLHPAVRESAGRRGFGFLSPSLEDQTVLGTVWDSCVFPHQAVEGRYLSEDRASVMMGGRRDEGVAGWTDEQLKQAAWSSLVDDTGVPEEETPDATEAWVARDAIPQYTVGHLERVALAEGAAAEHAPWLRLLGNSYYGVGAAACISNARGAAAQTASDLEA